MRRSNLFSGVRPCHPVAQALFRLRAGIAGGQARLDLLVAGRLIVELKASDGLVPLHLAQVLSYLRATGQPLGLLINFNVPVLQQGIRRVILTQHGGRSRRPL